MTMAISVKNLCKSFRIYHSPKDRLRELLHPFRKKYHQEFWALKDVSFDIKKGEIMGIIGKNGSGKSTLLQILCGIMPPTTGDVSIRGRISALLELGAGFNPVFTGRENVFMNGALMGFTKEEMNERFQTIAEFADIGDFIEQPVRTYSSGMFVRLAFACAVNVDPDILVVDEALAVGDMYFQKKCLNKMNEFRAQGKTILFVSHNLYAVRTFCERCIWLKNGGVAEIGISDHVVSNYMNHIQQQAPENVNIKSMRMGSGDVTIVSAKLLDDDGNEKREYKTGQDLTLEVKYHAKEKIVKPSFGLALFTNDTTPVRITTSNTKWHGRSPDYILGEGLVKFKLRSLPLLPGDYSFCLAIKDEYDLIISDRIENLITFSVLEGEAKKGIISESGILYYPGEWNFL